MQKHIYNKSFSFKYWLGCFLVLGVLAACENDLAEVQKFIVEDQVAIEVGKEVEVIYSDSGRVQMKVIAPVLFRHLDKKQPKREFPEGLEVYFIGEEQTVESWLKGKHAIEIENQQLTTIRDSVVLVNKNGEKLETDHLIWDQKSGKIYTEQLVRMTTIDKRIWGYGFEADREFKTWSIKAVKGELKVDPNNLSN